MSILIWDQEGRPPSVEGYSRIIFWRSFDTKGVDNGLSISQVVEDNDKALRERFLAWVYEVGETTIFGENLIDYFKLDSGFSLWWMSSFTEKCNFASSPHINAVIKLMAFVSLYDRQVDGCNLVLSSPDSRLSRILSGWSIQHGVQFRWDRAANVKVKSGFMGNWHKNLPLTIKSILWLLRYAYKRMPLRGRGFLAWRQSLGDVTLVSYFFNMTADKLKNGEYESSYWGNLPEELRQAGLNVRWLHIYFESSQIPSAKIAGKYIDDFNRIGSRHEAHATLDSFLNLQILIQVFREWIFIRKKNKYVDWNNITPLLDGLEVSPLFEDDWNNSFAGIALMRSLLNWNLISSAFSYIGKQRIGVYLMENQGWEYAAIQSWRDCGHGNIVGCVHSTIRYWDMRYFDDSRLYSGSYRNSIPKPDLVAVNGKANKNILINFGYPLSRLIDVEALRYLHLSGMESSVRRSILGEKKQNQVRSSSNSKVRLLVLGDYLEENTRFQMQMLEAIYQEISDGVTIVVKPHPASHIKYEDYPGLHFSLDGRPIDLLLQEVDIAYASCTTSAAIDAYCMGVPVIVVIDGVSMNGSPLRGHNDVNFVSNSVQLMNLLLGKNCLIEPAYGSDDFFYLGSELNGWKNLLGFDGSCEEMRGN